MKDEESELADELFDVVKALVEKSTLRIGSAWRIGDYGVRFTCFLPRVLHLQWCWGTKEEFLVNRPGQEWVSFAKACETCEELFQYLGPDLKDAVRIMAGSSSLEEIRLKFAAASLLPERTR